MNLPKSPDLGMGAVPNSPATTKCEFSGLEQGVAVHPSNQTKSLQGDDAPSTFEAPVRAAGEAEIVLEMRHPASGDSRRFRAGYSREVALLGPIELIRRGDWRGVVVSVALPIVGQLLLAPTANRSYAKLLVRRGYRAVSREPGQVSRVEWMFGLQLPRYAGRNAKSDA